MPTTATIEGRGGEPARPRPILRDLERASSHRSKPLQSTFVVVRCGRGEHTTKSDLRPPTTLLRIRVPRGAERAIPAPKLRAERLPLSKEKAECRYFGNLWPCLMLGWGATQLCGFCTRPIRHRIFFIWPTGASFPYGGKSRIALVGVVGKAITRS
jgi:hypothetical protein